MKHPHTPWDAVLRRTVVFSALSVLACSQRKAAPTLEFQGGQTGDEGGSQYARMSGSANQICDFEESAFTRTETTVYGTSIEELMAPFQPTEPIPFHWQDYSWLDSIQLSSTGATSLQLQPEFNGGTSYEIRLKPWNDQGAVGRCDGVWYEVPVQLHWSTADGALDEAQQWREINGQEIDGMPAASSADGRRPPPSLPLGRPVVLLVTSPQMAYLQHRFYLSNLNGSLELSSQEVEWDRAALDANVWLYHGASRGRLDLQLEGRRALNNPQPSDQQRLPAAAAPATTDEPFVPEITSYVGVWPSALSCQNGMSPLSPEANVIGRSSVELLELIAQAPTLTRSASSDSADPGSALSTGTMMVDFEALPEQLCLGISGAAVSFPALTQLSESELGTRLQFPVQVSANLDRLGELSTLSFSRQDWLQPMTTTELEALGIKLEQSADYLDFYLQWNASYTQQDGFWAGSATLRIHGRTPDPQCLSADAESEVSQPVPATSSACGRMDSVYLEEERIAVPPGTRLLEIKYKTTLP